MVGRPINPVEALSKSVSLILRHPIILLPQVFTLVLALFSDLLASEHLAPVSLLVDLLVIILDIIIAGAYPVMVKALLDGGQVSITGAMARGFHKFWSLLGAGILVGLLVLLGTIALVVPGIIFLTWYAFTAPAIMLEDKGALEGMAASKAFGRDKKWSTFLILLILFVVFGIISAVVGVATVMSTFSTASSASPAASVAALQKALVPFEVVFAIVGVLAGAIYSVVFSYAYIAYGPLSVPAGAGAAGPGAGSSPAVQPAAQTVGGTTSRFCTACGSPIPQGGMFCSNCGKPV